MEVFTEITLFGLVSEIYHRHHRYWLVDVLDRGGEGEYTETGILLFDLCHACHSLVGVGYEGGESENTLMGYIVTAIIMLSTTWKMSQMRMLNQITSTVLVHDHYQHSQYGLCDILQGVVNQNTHVRG
jgi:hypothetical protein